MRVLNPVTILKVLIIDNSVNNINHLKNVLLDLNLSISINEKSTIHEGILLIKSEEIDVVLANYELEESGITDLLNDLKVLLITIPVVVYTNNGNEMKAVEVLKSGAFDYIPIPFFNQETALKLVLNIIQNRTTEFKTQEFESQLIKLSSLVEQSPSLIVIMDTKGNIEFVNRLFVEKTGYTFEEVEGRDFNFLKSDTTSLDLYYEMWESLLLNNYWNGEYENVTKSGEKFWVQCSAISVLNKRGEVTNYAIIEQDITQRKMYEIELKLAKEEADRANRYKSEFLAKMSHELRTPLNAIIGFTEAMLVGVDGPLTPEQETSLKRVSHAGTNLLRLINDTLDLSKIEAGKMEVWLEDAKICEVLQYCFDLVMPLANDKKLQLIADFPEYDVEVKIDIAKIKQVVINLLSNSLKFTKEGFVRMSYYTTPLNLVIEIEDTGIGMTQEEVSRIFNDFVQADSSVSRNYGGTGLGLTISKKLMEMHQGRIAVESVKNRGSVFALFLPLKSIDLLSTEDQSESEVGDTIAKVLIIDDDKDITEVLKKLLELEKYDVRMVNDSFIALQETKEYMPDVILLDIMMPRKDGFEVLEELHADEKTMNIPVITISMFGNKEMVFSKGVKAILTKPLKKDELYKTISQVIAHKEKA